MAAPLKKGLLYFSLDVDIFDNEDLFDLQNDFGPLGEVIYLRLLCLVYKNGYYYEFKSIDALSALLIKSIGNKWTRGKSFVAQVIPRLADYDLFDKDLMSRGVLTSVGIQRRYLKAVKRRQSNIEKYWLLENESDQEVGESTPQNIITECINEVIVDNNSENECSDLQKEKKIKENNNTLSNAHAGTHTRENHIFTSDERKALHTKGVPDDYIEFYFKKVEKRGYQYDDHASTILSWWQKDKHRWCSQPTEEGSSFDTDEFFEAALRRSYGDQYDEIFGNKEAKP